MNTPNELQKPAQRTCVSLEGKALILDFGSVISRSIFEKRFEIATKLGLPKGAINWPGPLDPKADDLWRDMLCDKLTEREYWARMAKSIGELVGQDWKPIDYLNAARAVDMNLDIRPEIIHLITIAKKAGAKVGVLSNELELFYGKESMDSIDILKEVDALVDATHTKILKPDPRAYEEILQLLGVSAENAVFVDDQPRNVKGSIDYGMKAVFFDVRDPQGVCEIVWGELINL